MVVGAPLDAIIDIIIGAPAICRKDLDRYQLGIWRHPGRPRTGMMASSNAGAMGSMAVIITGIAVAVNKIVASEHFIGWIGEILMSFINASI